MDQYPDSHPALTRVLTIFGYNEAQADSIASSHLRDSYRASSVIASDDQFITYLRAYSSTIPLSAWLDGGWTLKSNWFCTTPSGINLFSYPTTSLGLGDTWSPESFVTLLTSREAESWFDASPCIA